MDSDNRNKALSPLLSGAFNVFSVIGLALICASPFWGSWGMAGAGVLIVVISVLPGSVYPETFGEHFLVEALRDDIKANESTNDMSGAAGSDGNSWWKLTWEAGGDGGDGGGGD